MNEVIQCGKGFEWSPQDHNFNQVVKSEYVVDDELFGVDKAPPMYSKTAKTVPTASTNDVAASLQTAFCRKPTHKSSDVMFNQQHRDDAIKSEMNENVYYNQNQYNNGPLPQVQQPHSDMNMQMNCNMNNAQSDAQQMDIYRDLILRHLIQDISTTCAKLGLPTDPYNWTTEHGSRWITEMCQQFNLTQPPQSYLTGRVLLGMSQKDFEALSPEGGDTLFAQLQLWKTAFESYQPQHCPAGQGGAITAADNSMPRNGWMENHCEKPSRPEFTQQPQQFNPEVQNMQQYYNNNSCFTPSATAEHSSFFNNETAMLSPSNSDMSSSSSMNDGNDDDCLDLQLNMLQLQRPQGIGFGGPQMMNNPMGMGSPTRDERPSPFPRHSGTVHLWHFIRELLDHPKQYGSCVRWVDRDEGTFKIESSHHLARFWGQRKNRSQMNYDKLSRSLRQYYKKGIIQKPEKKQRLVYKFLPPYNL